MTESGANGANVSPGRARGRALEAAEAAGEGGIVGLLAGLAERTGANAGVSAVFGEPVEKDGRTIITVAQSLWGSGAGSGTSDEDAAGRGSGSGAGGGGGAATRPVGYIEITADGAGYVPLQRPWQDAKLVVAWAVAIWLVSRAVNRILRG
jgi:uncharacterized spore protein YtfJ